MISMISFADPMCKCMGDTQELNLAKSGKAVNKHAAGTLALHNTGAKHGFPKLFWRQLLSCQDAILPRIL